mmetsp:Transcript_34318/g.67489  ORF Transcript_34318/g.67489 Transcript_34318/m.67489 type:complete len:490 (-) Transcript_34318:21-1490(-)
MLPAPRPLGVHGIVLLHPPEGPVVHGPSRHEAVVPVEVPLHVPHAHPPGDHGRHAVRGPRQQHFRGRAHVPRWKVGRVPRVVVLPVDRVPHHRLVLRPDPMGGVVPARCGVLDLREAPREEIEVSHPHEAGGDARGDGVGFGDHRVGIRLPRPPPFPRRPGPQLAQDVVAVLGRGVVARSVPRALAGVLPAHNETERPCRRDPQVVHRLARQVLPDGTPQHRPSVGAPAERRGPRPLELHLQPLPVVHRLAHAEGAAVAVPLARPEGTVGGVGGAHDGEGVGGRPGAHRRGGGGGVPAEKTEEFFARDVPRGEAEVRGRGGAVQDQPGGAERLRIDRHEVPVLDGTRAHVAGGVAHLQVGGEAVGPRVVQARQQARQGGSGRRGLRTGRHVRGGGGGGAAGRGRREGAAAGRRREKTPAGPPQEGGRERHGEAGREAAVGAVLLVRGRGGAGGHGTRAEGTGARGRGGVDRNRRRDHRSNGTVSRMRSR